MKVKIEIPENFLHLLNPRIAELHGKIVADVRFSDGDFASLKNNVKIPLSWCKVVKEPISFEEWFENKKKTSTLWKHCPSTMESIRFYCEMCHEWTIENEKLKRENVDN